MGQNQSSSGSTHSRQSALTRLSIDLNALPDLPPAQLNQYKALYPHLSLPELYYAYYTHAYLVQLIPLDWTLSRAVNLLCDKDNLSLAQYLKIIDWWHKSPLTSKLQYIFNFLDVNEDDKISLSDLLLVLPRLIQCQVQVNDEVYVKKPGFLATIKYQGLVPELGTGSWLGIEYLRPFGSTNGTVKNNHYFDCLPGYGQFIRNEHCILRSTYEWIQAIFVSVLNQPIFEFGKFGVQVAAPDLSIDWIQFSLATVNDPVVKHKLMKWMFPLSLHLDLEFPPFVCQPHVDGKSSEN